MGVRTPGSGSTSRSVNNAKARDAAAAKKKTITTAATQTSMETIAGRLMAEGYTIGSPAWDQAMAKYKRDPAAFDRDFAPDYDSDSGDKAYIGKVPGNQPKDTRALEVLKAFGFEDPIIDAFRAASQLQPGV